MLGLDNAESSRACALIAALDAREITLCEFADAIQPLTPEALQVTATVLSLNEIANGDYNRRRTSAYMLCRRLAAAVRNLS